jgi:hypothetical protein
MVLFAGLSGCASLSHYEQSFAQPSPVTAPSSSALRQAEARGYAAGLAAGKRIQARRDQALTQAAQDKAAAAAAAMAQQAVAETQGMQALHKLCDPPQPAAQPAPAGANATTAARTSSPDAFAPSGPARPLGGAPDPF